MQINKYNLPYEDLKTEIWCRKACDKDYCDFMIKIWKKLGLKGAYLNIVTAIHYKLVATVTLNDEKLKPTLAWDKGSYSDCYLMKSWSLKATRGRYKWINIRKDEVEVWNNSALKRHDGLHPKHFWIWLSLSVKCQFPESTYKNE